jgi:putative glycerol-1-phosphate prenyltransferase
MTEVYQKLLDVRERRGGGFMLLIDPDKTNPREYIPVAEAAEECGVDALLVGTSFMLGDGFSSAVEQIKQATHLPVIIFPGSFNQITPHADAILFSSLISSRNATYLIDEQVRGAPLVRQYDLEPIPTGYMLIESGAVTSVQFISGSMGIPRNKYDIACAHAMAAECLGMKLIYLEAGSGAQQAVPVEMVGAVERSVQIPIIVGGGLQSADECAARIEAGASFLVMGNCLEQDIDLRHLRELTSAAHPRESIRV